MPSDDFVLVLAGESWEASSLPDWLVEAIVVERYNESVEAASKRAVIQEAGDAEVLAYLITLILSNGTSVPDDYKQIFLYLWTRLLKRRGEKPTNTVDELSLDQKGLLNQLRYVIWRGRGRARSWIGDYLEALEKKMEEINVYMDYRARFQYVPIPKNIKVVHMSLSELGLDQKTGGDDGEPQKP